MLGLLLRIRSKGIRRRAVFAVFEGGRRMKRVTMNFVELIEWMENRGMLTSEDATAILSSQNIVMPRTILWREE